VSHLEGGKRVTVAISAWHCTGNRAVIDRPERVVETTTLYGSKLISIRSGRTGAIRWPSQWVPLECTEKPGIIGGWVWIWEQPPQLEAAAPVQAAAPAAPVALRH